MPAAKGKSKPNVKSRRPGFVDAHVGLRVRTRRQELNLSQEKLGDLVGLTFQQVQKYEKGLNRIGAGRLFELSQALEVRVDYFFQGLGKDLAGGNFEPSEPGPGRNGAAPNGADSAGQTRSQADPRLLLRDDTALAEVFSQIPDPGIRQSIANLIAHLARIPDAPPRK